MNKMKQEYHGDCLKGRNCIAVLIPCYNESQTVAKVIADYRKALPEADIYVYDNNSTDGTADIALQAGAIVRHEYRQGGLTPDD